MPYLVRETDIEAPWAEWADSLRGVVQSKYKHVSREGAPDRIIFLLGGVTFFIEFKKPGEAPRASQIRYHKMLRRMGFRVYVLDDLEEAKRVTLQEITDHAPNL